ncbi:MAG: hypothetical protein JWL76_411 [Thermoleophilia bacterium]|nr:hypothetical protein [Thermoleophilia bacterium]
MTTMTFHSRAVLLLSMFALLVAPAIAAACSMVVRPPAKPHIAVDDLRFLHVRRSTSAEWVRGSGWISSRVGLIESIQPRFLRRPVAAAYAQQRGLNLIAIRPLDGTYYDDEDPATTCELEGRHVYSATRLLVRETPRAIFITLASHRTPGSSAGCLLASTSCDDLVLRSVTFDAPIGDREIYATTFPNT